MERIATKFWKRLWVRVQPDLESWLVDTFGYLLIFTSLALSHSSFWVLVYLGLNPHLIDFLETADHIAIGVIFVTFLLGLIRRSILSLVKMKDNDGK
jgi:hypothetical protein